MIINLDNYRDMEYVATFELRKLPNGKHALCLQACDDKIFDIPTISKRFEYLADKCNEGTFFLMEQAGEFREDKDNE